MAATCSKNVKTAPAGPPENSIFVNKFDTLGKLYIIPTPVGNLEDITLRALRILKEVDFILAEDTRTTSFLLQHYGIQKPLRSNHKFNEHKASEHWIQQLQAGETAALVSDAGTPGISDPGFFLVRACVEAGIEVECLPGATALIPALVISGFPTDAFVFEGFLPHKKGRKTAWEKLLHEERTVAFYESPHRLLKALEECETILGPARQISVSREISKKFEETVRGPVSEVKKHFTEKGVKGEFVIIIKGISKKDKKDD